MKVMDDNKILEKAIKKVYPESRHISVYKKRDSFVIEIFFGEEVAPRISTNYESIIFSHKIAKKFFGENYILHPTETVGLPETRWYHDEQCYKKSYQHKKVISWQYHLQQMVLEKNYIKYLKKFL